MKQAFIADTGGLLRGLAKNAKGEPAWPEFAEALKRASAIIVPSLVLAEVDYFLRAERSAMRRFLLELFDPQTTYEYEPITPGDMLRAMQFDAKFSKLELGLVDGVVAAVAERRGVYRVLTSDRRDFGAIRVGPRFQRPLTLLPPD